MVGPLLNSPNSTIKLPSSTVKFLCSSGGKILPRFQDGKLRYHGGQTRVLAVKRSISFHELLVKLAEICGESVTQFRCQLPTEDLDALVSITSDEDLANIIEEYDRFSTSSVPGASIKIRTFISVPKRLSPPSSVSTTSTHARASSSSSSSSRSNGSTSPPIAMNSSFATNNLMSGKSVNLMSGKSVSLRNQRSSPCHMSATRPGMVQMYQNKSARTLPQYAYSAYGNTRRQMYLVHNGNYWQ